MFKNKPKSLKERLRCDLFYLEIGNLVAASIPQNRNYGERNIFFQRCAVDQVHTTEFLPGTVMERESLLCSEIGRNVPLKTQMAMAVSPPRLH